jgi:hypothetical protein
MESEPVEGESLEAFGGWVARLRSYDRASGKPPFVVVAKGIGEACFSRAGA